MDAKSSFGVKQPIKHAILTKDAWFPSADSMVSFLQQNFEEYNLIEEELTTKARAKKQGEHALKPCRCFHMIAVDPEGYFSKELYIREIDLCKFGTYADTVQKLMMNLLYTMILSLNLQNQVHLLVCGAHLILLNIFCCRSDCKGHHS